MKCKNGKNANNTNPHTPTHTQRNVGDRLDPVVAVLRTEVAARDAQLRRERREHALRVAELEDGAAEQRHQRQLTELRCRSELEAYVAECSRLQEETAAQLARLRAKQDEVEAVVPELRRKLEAARRDFAGEGG
jgi:hypothetical protein